MKFDVEVISLESGDSDSDKAKHDQIFFLAGER